MFDFLIDLLAMLGFLGVFSGIMGGLGFWANLFDQLYQHRIKEKEKEANGCKGCQDYERCLFLFGEDLPDSPCAYWKKKRTD